MDLVANEALDESSHAWLDEEDSHQADIHHLVPARLVPVAKRLKEIDECDDSNAMAALSRMKLPQMTGQIRDVEQRALEIAREEGREEFRVMALKHNLINYTLPSAIATARAEARCGSRG